MSKIKKSVKFGPCDLILETGEIANQASGAVMVTYGGTTVLVTIVGVNNPSDVKDFLPLRVDYQERFYACGKIPGGFFKREGRPSERETLIARLMDRPLRPLFPKGFSNEVQVTATVLSLNPDHDSDIPAMVGASAALAISGIPFTEIMAAARIGYIDGCYILNPSREQLESSDLDLVVAGTNSSVLMVESEAKELSESVMLGAVMFGHKQFQPIIDLIKELESTVGTPKWDWQPVSPNQQLIDNISNSFKSDIENCYQIRDKKQRQFELSSIKDKINEKFIDPNDENLDKQKLEIGNIVEDISKQVVRSKILDSGMRIDGRDLTTVRNITSKVKVLERTHGSALFTRGETQALVTVTLGSTKDAQIIDSILGERKESFMLHYNFPPYCVGEVGMVGSPKRREVGHGNLAKRGIKAVLPTLEEFPYVIRVVSEIMGSNGSSSMASICGSSLALMDAGVPIKEPVAGIAMGLILENNNFAVISDILGDEDHLGDMDFKVAGTSKGVTALQMDIKVSGITEEIMDRALLQAKQGRLHILDVMGTTINKPKQSLSDYAPSIVNFKIAIDKIKDVIGKGGATIKSLIENTDSSIDIQEDGTVQITAATNKKGLEIKEKIEKLCADVEVGKIYSGKVVRIVDFGAFVNILPGKDGLVHISQIADKRVNKVEEELDVGQEIKVKVLDIDKQGKVKLSIKALLESTE